MIAYNLMSHSIWRQIAGGPKFSIDCNEETSYKNQIWKCNCRFFLSWMWYANL